MQEPIRAESYVTSEMAASDPKIKAFIRSISLPFRDCTTPHNCSYRNGKEEPQKPDREKRLQLGYLCLGLSMLAVCAIALRSFVRCTSDNI